MQPLYDEQPPPPSISHPGLVTTDITGKFAAAVKTLAPGELIKDDQFTLFESVSALEIMDPKMDSGVLAEGESLDEEYDVSRELLPEEILGIIDQLLCLEMAWHLGYPLSQTLLTSVYVEALMNPRPTSIDEANFVRDPNIRPKPTSLLFVLRAYCVGLLKSCYFVNELVKPELYYEEEDFVTNTYDRDLLRDIQVSDINRLLQSARTELRALSNDVPKDISLALDMRIELRMAFLRAIDLGMLLGVNVDTLKMPWIQMKGLMERIEEQNSLGKPVPEAFSTKLQRRLASTMPPRPIVRLSFEECSGHFKRLFQDGHDVSDVLKYSDTQSLLTFVTLFQAQKPQPLVFIRTLLQNMLFKDMIVLGQYSIRQLLDDDLSITVAPNAAFLDRSFDNIEVPTDPRHQIAVHMEDFRQRVADIYFDLFRIWCQNRCRVRRTLCHHIQEWDMLETDALQTDQLLLCALEERVPDGFSMPLSAWARFYKLRAMEWTVQLGFELKVYQPDELSGMYWYLYYIARARAEHCEDMQRMVLDKTPPEVRELELQSPSSSNDAKKQSQLTPRAHTFLRARLYQRLAMLDATCTWEFADGLSALYLALTRMGLITPTAEKRPVVGIDAATIAALRYRLRMKPFAAIADPPMLSATDFSSATSRPETPKTSGLLGEACLAVSRARLGFETLGRLPEPHAFAANCHPRWVTNVKDGLRAAIGAGIVASNLFEAVEEIGEADSVALKNAMTKRFKVEIPEPGKGYHDWWVVPKLVPLA
ncbi:Mak10-domain-containing protein [Xylariomycetidae sp. FL0641]|nr:Mak10-domain-containing protein [Xylariomycetidae sp. FL0641]